MNKETELYAALQSAVAIADEAAEEWDKAPSGMRAGKLLLALCGHLKGYRTETDAIHRALEEWPDKWHETHKLRGSDASTFDVVCVYCGAKDQVPGGWGNLRFPCTKAP